MMRERGRWVPCESRWVPCVSRWDGLWECLPVPVFTLVPSLCVFRVGKMVRKRHIGDLGDATFGDETRLRTHDDAMSVGCVRFLREVAVRFWMVMMRPTRWDPVRYQRMYRGLYDRIQAGVMRHGDRWGAVRILHMLIIRVEWMCAPIWSAGRVLRSHVGVKKARFKE